MRKIAFEKLGLACCVLSLCLLHAASAAGFCRSTTCDPRTAAPEEMCMNGDDGCPITGFPLEWRTGCVSFSVHSAGSERHQIDLEQAQRIAERTFTAWLSADCGAGIPSLEWTQLGVAECGQAEYNSSDENANVILFQDEEWPHDPTAVAITTTTQSLKTGELYDADIELNSANYQLTTGNSRVEYDLESVLMHEVGHFLGLGDNAMDRRTTMHGLYSPGDVSRRQLSDDDVNGICSIYPPGEGPASVRCTPRHGFSPECASAETSGCGCSLPGQANPRFRGLALLGLLLFSARRKGRRVGPQTGT